MRPTELQFHRKEGTMLKLVILAVILDIAWCLQAGLQYKYRYSGRVTTGMSEVTPQVAAAGMMADLLIWVNEDAEITFQLKDIKVGDINGDGGCDPRNPPIEYNTLIDHADTLTKTFMVKLVNGSMTEIIVPSADPSWVTNVRRSILNLFNIPVLHVNFGGEESIFRAEPVFARDQQTPMGDCKSIYTLTHLVDVLEQAENKSMRANIIEDIQFSDSYDPTQKTPEPKSMDTQTEENFRSELFYSNPYLSEPRFLQTKAQLREEIPAPITKYTVVDNMWRLIRDVDFAKCQNPVVLNCAGVVMISKAGKPNCGEDYYSSFSNSIYTLRGGQNGVRIEKAVVDGFYIVDPLYGAAQEHLTTFVNQTVELISVKKNTRTDDTSLSGYSSVNWIHDIQPIESDPDQQLSMIQTVSGLTTTPDDIKLLKDQLLQMLHTLPELLGTGRPVHTIGDFEAFTENLHYLSMEDLREIYDTIQESPHMSINSLELYMKLCAASGTEHVTLFLLEKLKINEDLRHVHLEFMLNMGANIKTNRLIEPIMNYTMYDLQDSMYRGMGIINFAILATRLCLHPCRPDPTAMSCKKLVETEFLKFMADGLNDESKPLNDRLIYMFALNNFKTDKIVPLIKPYALGTATSSIVMRTFAMYALRSENIPYSAKAETLQILMAVLENPVDHHRVREDAFSMVMSWFPTPQWWHHIAKMTWREPDQSLATLMSSVIKIFGDLVPSIRRISPLAKPVAPISFHTAGFTFKTKTKPADTFNYWYELVTSKNRNGLFPTFLYHSFRIGFLNLYTHAANIGYHFIDSDVWSTLYNFFVKEDIYRDDRMRQTVAAMLRENQLKLNSKKNPVSKTKFDILVHIVILQYFQFGFPATLDTDTLLPNLLKLRNTVVDLKLSHQTLINTGRISQAVPTELGLPLVIQHTVPSMFSINTKPKVQNMEVFSETYNIDLDISARLETMVQVTSRVLVPWSNKAMVSGVKSHQTLLFPFNTKIDLLTAKKDLTIKLSPHDPNTEELMSYENLPFTLRAPINMAPRLSAVDDFKVVRIGPGLKVQSPIIPDSGMNVTSVWDGDVDYLFTQENINSFFTSPIPNVMPPTVKYFAWSMKLDQEYSESKSFTLSFNYVRSGKEPISNDIPEFPSDPLPSELSTSTTAATTTTKTTTTTTTTTTPASTTTAATTINPNIKPEAQEFLSRFNKRRRTRTFVDRITMRLQQKQQTKQQRGRGRVGGRGRYVKLKFEPPIEREEYEPAWKEKRKQIDTIQSSFTFIGAGVIRSLAVGVEFHSLQSRPYKAVFTWAESKLSGGYGSKLRITLYHPKHTNCLDLEWMSPSLLRMSTLSELLSRDLTSNLNAKFYLSEECQGPEPTFKVQGSLRLSDEKKQSLLTESSSDCAPDPDFSHVIIPEYDKFRLQFDWSPTTPPHVVNMTYWVGDLLQGGAFPSISFNHFNVYNQPQQTVFEAIKSLKSSTWSIGVKKSNEVAMVHSLQFPQLVDELLSPRPFRITLFNKIVMGDTYPICAVSDAKVRTFDSFVYNVEPWQCWVVLVNDCWGSDFMITYRKLDKLEVQILWPAGGIRIDMDETIIKVNLQKVNDEDHTDRYHMFYFEDSTLAMFSNGFSVRVSKQISITIPSRLKGKVCGLCGNMDGEITAEMEGPQGCIFTDPKMFSLSWMVSGDKCNSWNVYAKQSKIFRLRKTCPKNRIISTGLHLDAPEACFNSFLDSNTNEMNSCPLTF